MKGLQNFHDKGEKASKNALEKLEGVMLPEFYKKVAHEMQKGKTTLRLLQESFNTIILEQWVPLHLNGQCVRPEKVVYRQQGLGYVSKRLRDTFSFSVL